MRVVLAVVPFASPFSPLLGAPLVAAGLKERGHQVALVDGALAALERLWTLDALDAGITHVRALVASHERRDELSRSAARDYQAAAQRLLGVEEIRARLEDALGFLRGNGRFEDADAYDQALEVLEAALRVSCAPWLPERVSLRSYKMPAPIKSVADLLAHARRPAERALFGTTLLQQMPAQVLSRLGAEPPDAVGVSITWPQQLGPAAMLSVGLRNAGYLGPIVWGGALMAHLVDDLLRAPELKDAGLVDAIIPVGGAEVLHRWWEARQRGETSVPGVVVPGTAPAKPAAPLALLEPPPAEVDAMPTPDFSDVPVRRYLSPRPVLPLLLSIGCYYQRCTFCDHFHSVQRFRPRKAAAVVEDMRRLHAATGCRDFYLVDDCSPPKGMREMADQLVQWRESGGPEVGWITECRAERILADDPTLLPRLVAGGCRMLLFGLESASDSVLEAMDKGETRAQFSRVLTAVHDAGIKVWAFYMLGFPAEASADAQATHDFMVEMRDVIDEVAGGPFVVTRHSPLAGEPTRYGIQLDSEKGKKKGTPAPSLELLVEHKGGKMTPAERDRRLAILQTDERLSHFRHPVVSEAHGLFLPRSYYHRPASTESPLPRQQGAVDWKTLQTMTVRVMPGVAVEHFRFPVTADLLPASGKILVTELRVLADIFRPGYALHVAAPVAALVQRCLESPALVSQRVQESVEAGDGTEGEVMQGIISLVERRFLTVEPGPG